MQPTRSALVRELVYVAGGSGTGVELGIATPTTGTTYVVTTTHSLPDAAVLPLVTRDIDGDMLPDAVGAAPNAFVYSTRYDTFVISNEPAAGVTAGDVDADGVAEVLVLTADKTAVRRLRFGTTGGVPELVGEPFLDARGDAIGAADLTGDRRADVIMVEDLTLPSSRLRLDPSQ